MEKRDKQLLREAMRQIRDGIPEELRRAKSERLAEQLEASGWYAQADVVLMYAAIRSEADLAEFCRRARRDGKCLYFPKVLGEELEFYRVGSEEQLTPGTFGVMEPVADAVSSDLQERCWKKPAGEICTIPILVPGLAFSRSGARMGYGKGYYDRYLAAHGELLPIGICFEEQITEAVPIEAHDRPMACVVTERGVIRCVQE